MKNIQLIPTDKPSRLYTNNGTLHLDKYSRASNGITINQHIYITSDEEIKEGDWIYYTSAIGYCKTTVGSKGLEQEGIPAKKIILTTDQSLDGVQAIDDEFLQWFCKNISCEEVEIKHFGTCCGNQLISQCINCNQYNPVYKTIIPKVEPLIEFTNTNDFTSMIYNPTDEKGRVMTYWGGLEEPKQKTLEEAAERLYPIILEDDGWDKNKQYRDEWIDGAKWQQERSYSEKEVLELLSKRGFDLKHKKDSKTTSEWFEQFKKK